MSDIDLIFSFSFIYRRVHGAEPVSLVMLHYSQSEGTRGQRTIVNTSSVDMYTLEAEGEEERERESVHDREGSKKNTTNRGLCAECACSLLAFFLLCVSHSSCSFLHCPSDRCCRRCRFIHMHCFSVSLFTSSNLSRSLAVAFSNETFTSTTKKSSKWRINTQSLFCPLSLSLSASLFNCLCTTNAN